MIKYIDMNKNIYHEYETFEGVIVPVCHREKYGHCEYEYLCELCCECIRQADYTTEEIAEIEERHGLVAA